MARKLAVVLLAVAMILSYVGTAAAAQFSDVAGHKHEAAIGRLASLGLLAGYPDGTFKPDQTITRAEFAKVIVIALGLKEAAEVMTGVPTAFSDVAATHWATGYINVAASQGIVNGYPDGTFKPDAQVTYAEALAMILRALGYEPTLKGVWPAKYLVKAAELGITKGVTFSANVPATRGDVAALVDNSLTVPKVVQVGYGETAKYVVSGTEGTTKQTLLEGLGATSVEGYLVASSELFGVAGDVIKLWNDKNGNYVMDPDEVTELTLAGGAQVQGLLGHSVKAWKNAEGKVFFVEDKTPADSVKTAKWDGTNLKVGTTVLDLTKAYFTHNRADFDRTPPTWANVDNAEARVILAADGKTVLFCATTTSKVAIVASVTNTSASQGISTEQPAGIIDLMGKQVIWQGAASSLAEVQKGDVIAYYEDDPANPTKYVINVVRNVVTGKLNAYVDSNMDGNLDAGEKLTVGTTEYVVAPGVADLAVSVLAGKDVKITLDPWGKVRKLVAVAAEAVKPLAMVVDVQNKYYLIDGALEQLPTLTLLKPDGTKLTARVASSSVSLPAGLGAKALVEYTLDASGNIDSITVLPAVTRDNWAALKDPGRLYSATPSPAATALVTADTVVFYAPGATAADFKTITADTLLAATNTFPADVYAPDNVTAKAVVVKGTITSVAVQPSYGLVVGDYIAADGKRHIKVNVKGTVTDYKFDVLYGTVALMSDVVVKFKAAADGSIAEFQELVPAVVGTVDAAGAGYVKVAGTTYLLTSNTQVFNLNAAGVGFAGTTGDLVVGLRVAVYAGSANEALVVTYNASVSGDTTPPAQPVISSVAPDGNLSASEVSNVTVSGTAEAGARVTVTVDDSDAATPPVTGAAVADANGNYSVTGLNLAGLADGTLTITVVATDAAGNVSTAATASVTKDTVAPAAPTGLTATATATAGQIELSWTANTEPDLDHYVVYKSTSSGTGYTQVATVSAGTNAYTVTGLTSGTKYYFVITAVDAAGNESGYSNEASATAP